MGDVSSLLHLRHLRLENCESCTQLPPLGQLPCLNHLEVTRLLGVKKVRGEFLNLGFGDDDQWGATIVAFPRLESPRLHDVGSWEQWVPLPSSILSSSSSSVLVPVPLVVVEKRAIKAEATIVNSSKRVVVGGMPQVGGVPPIFTTAFRTLRELPALRSMQYLLPSIQSLKLAGVLTEKLLADCATTLLPSLQHLEIRADPELTDQLPPTLLHLSALQSLKIVGCVYLRSAPEWLRRMTQFA